MHLVAFAGTVEVSSHAQDGRDSDTSREQEMFFSILSQLEVVSRCADLQAVTFSNSMMHGKRATARRGFPQHADDIPVVFTGIVAEGILAHEATW